MVAMRGGVDSSVTAALLVEQGYEGIGMTMQIWPSGEGSGQDGDGEPAVPSAVDDARQVAAKLGIPIMLPICGGFSQEGYRLL